MLVRLGRNHLTRCNISRLFLGLLGELFVIKQWLKEYASTEEVLEIIMSMLFSCISVFLQLKVRILPMAGITAIPSLLGG